jgi:hypothetical protein
MVVIRLEEGFSSLYVASSPVEVMGRLLEAVHFWRTTLHTNPHIHMSSWPLVFEAASITWHLDRKVFEIAFIGFDAPG